MDNLKIKLPPHISKIIDILNSNGHKAYIVGGCVRDSFLNRNPYDWDVTTSALPEQTIECFKDYKTVLTGLKHGTVCVVIDKNPVEITTFRTEGSYCDNRHPDKVVFIDDIKEDLARRDFTINSIAYNDNEGIVDPFGGIDDIKNKIIRCVGDAKERFDEDALRIIRAIRFSSVLDFEIEEKTSDAIHDKKLLIKNVSCERIRLELEKLLVGKNAFDVLQKYSDIIFTIIPELKPTKETSQNCKYHIYNVWDHICHSVKEVEADKELRLVMLLHDIAKPVAKTTDDNGVDHFKTHAKKSGEMAKAILKNLKFDNKTSSEVVNLIIHHDDRLYNNIDELPLYISEFGYDFLRKLDKISRADIKGQNNKYLDRISLCDEFILKLNELEEKNICVSIKDLKINGNDLKQLGYSGKEIGEKFDCLLKKVLKNEIKNEKEILLENAKKV